MAMVKILLIIVLLSQFVICNERTVDVIINGDSSHIRGLPYFITAKLINNTSNQVKIPIRKSLIYSKRTLVIYLQNVQNKSIIDDLSTYRWSISLSKQYISNFPVKDRFLTEAF
jgi:hypothetical protein